MDLELKELGNFTGTSQYYNLMGYAKVTDGVKYLMENGYSWFVTDALIYSVMNIKEQPFQVFWLEVDKRRKMAKMKITDGNENMLCVKYYDFTDAERDLKLYFVDGVLLLPSEY